MSKQYIFTMAKLCKKYGTKTILNDVWLSFYPGAKIGVLGKNGTGKSTLLKIMAGLDQEFDGEARLTDGFTCGYLPQEPQLDAEKNVWENVMTAVAPRRQLLDRFNELSAQRAEPLEEAAMEKVYAEMARVQDEIDATNTWDLDREIEVAFQVMNLPDKEASVEQLSGGERRRIALCQLLLEKPDLLLLDEPTNHLDADSVQWLERTLHQYHGTVVAVTHDRYFLDNVAGWILELDQGRGIPWKGNYSSWLEQKQDRLRQEEKSESDRQKTLQRELEWVRMTPRAKQQKNKARLRAYEELLNQDRVERNEELQIYIPPGPRLGDVVIEADGLRKTYGDRIIFEDMSFRMPPGGIVGIIGPNGAGKTTLFRLITGQEEPDEGGLKLGDTTELAYVDQTRETLDPNKTVWEEISGGEEEIELGERTVNSRAYVGRFNFGGSDQQQKVGELSGGQRNRVNIAKMLKEGANVILLDEPTNDLDVNTLRALEEGLENFAGCALVISHDRWFLDRLATHILAFEGDSQVYWFEGNYSEYEENRRQRLGVDAEIPKRVHYRQLTRD